MIKRLTGTDGTRKTISRDYLTMCNLGQLKKYLIFRGERKMKEMEGKTRVELRRVALLDYNKG